MPFKYVYSLFKARKHPWVYASSRKVLKCTVGAENVSQGYSPANGEGACCRTSPSTGACLLPALFDEGHSCVGPVPSWAQLRSHGNRHKANGFLFVKERVLRYCLLPCYAVPVLTVLIAADAFQGVCVAWAEL